MNWLAIACADHVARGRSGGFMQVCHGKDAPLRRVRPGDRVICYSPTRAFQVRDGLQSFTAFGTASGTAPYRVDMGGGFRPFRLDVEWQAADVVPIRPLLQQLELTRGKANWAYPFRFGILAISDADCAVIAGAMGAGFEGLEASPPVEPDLFAPTGKAGLLAL